MASIDARSVRFVAIFPIIDFAECEFSPYHLRHSNLAWHPSSQFTGLNEVSWILGERTEVQLVKGLYVEVCLTTACRTGN